MYKKQHYVAILAQPKPTEKGRLPLDLESYQNFHFYMYDFTNVSN